MQPPEPPVYPQPKVYPQHGVQAQAAYPVSQGEVMQGMPGQTIVIQAVAPQAGNRVYTSYPAKVSRICGWTQIAIGIILIILHIVMLALRSALSPIGHGIWCGIFFIITGAFGVAAGKHRTQCPIVTFMVLSIVAAALMCSILFSLGVVGVLLDGDLDYSYRNDNKDEIRIALNKTIAALAVIEGVVAIVSSILCCRRVCCGGPPAAVNMNSPEHPNNQFVTASQQVVYVPQGVQLQPQARAMVVAGPSVPAANNGPPPDYNTTVNEKPGI